MGIAVSLDRFMDVLRSQRAGSGQLTGDGLKFCAHVVAVQLERIWTIMRS